MEPENENGVDGGDEIPEKSDDGNMMSTSEFPAQERYGQLQCYPVASASHDAVVKDAELFMTTLNTFLAALETKLIVPVIGDREINLHDFYCEVTACGGLEKVIRSGNWKELCDKLLMSSNISNKYYVLRKHYMSLLFHYEQVYFFRAEGQLLSAPAPLPAPIPVDQPAEPTSPYEVPFEIRSLLKKKKRKLDPIQVFGVDPAAAVGSMATGAINGKFDEGYFVTVVVGTEKLSGVLYHFSPRKKAQQFASVPSLLEGIGTETTTSGLEIQLYGKKRKDNVRKKDPNGPKRTRTGYNIYFKEQRARLKELYPDKKGLGKKVIEMWNKLPENEKSYYIALGNVEKERYLTEYREKMKLQQSQVDGTKSAGGILPVLEVDHDAYYVSHDYHVSLDVENEVQPGHASHMSESDQIYHGYHESHSQLMESEASAGRLVAEQTYEMQDDGDYPQEPVSEEDGDGNEAEDIYDAEEDETIYRSADKILEEQEGSEYQASEQEYDITEEAYPAHTNELKSHEVRSQNTTSILKQAYYGQDHQYPYVPAPLQQQMEGSQGSAQQSPYQVRDNGQVIYPHLQQGRSDMVENPVSQHHLFPRESYGYSHGRSGESLGVPHPQEQGAFSRQDETGSYMVPLHQNQAMVSNIQTRSEQAYPDRYSYPVHMQHPQMYAHMPLPQHGYPSRMPHPPYPVQWNDTQNFHHGHGYAPRLHQPQVVVPEVAGMRPPSQAYESQDGGHAYNS